MRHDVLSKIAFAVWALVVLGVTACDGLASDHWDSPNSRKDQTADLTDVYAFPTTIERPGAGPQLVLIMSVHPYANPPRALNFAGVGGTTRQPIPFSLGNGEVKQPGTMFSDSVQYTFRIRPASILGHGENIKLITQSDTEFQVVCTFDDPVPSPIAVTGGGALDMRQTMSCIVRRDTTITQSVRCRRGIRQFQFVRREDFPTVQIAVDDETGGNSGFVKIFAGCRADPSFIDANRSKERNRLRDPDKDEVLSEPQFNPVLHGNVMSIVVMLDIDKVFGNQRRSSQYAVVAQTSAGNRQIDRMGRILVNSFLVGRQENVFATPDVDAIKDAWNSDDAFQLDSAHLQSYKTSIQAGLMHIDGMDGEPLDWAYRPQHAFLDILLQDFLLVDTTKPVSADSAEHTYMEIETSRFLKNDYHTCGGRLPNDDVVDTWLTWFINGPNRPKPLRGDSLKNQTPGKEARKQFPFLAPPHITKDATAP